MPDYYPIHTVVDAHASVRNGPPDFAVDSTKPPIPQWTRVGIFECQGDNCHVAKLFTGPDLGWTRRSNLRVLYRDTPTMTAGPMTPDTAIAVDASWTPRKKALAATYNRLGGLLGQLSRLSGIELPVALAVWYVESGGRAMVANRAVLRFENHVLFNRWGTSHSALFDQHFVFGGHGAGGADCDKSYKCHSYRVADSGQFSPSHTGARDAHSQDHEYEALELAQRIAGDVAYECASYGGPQIMGFNHKQIGYETAHEMYDSFQASERYHVFGFFDICYGPATAHLIAGRYEDFARIYNGSGEPATYASKITAALADARAIMPALSRPERSEGPAGLSHPERSEGPALSLQDASINIDYEVELVPQPDKRSCWAASMAMLAGYKRGTSVDAEALAREVSRSLRTSYTWDMLNAVKQQVGLRQISLPSNLSFAPRPEQWHDWLRDFGPLWVTTTGAPSHAIVIDGIRGELAPDRCELHVLNPWDTRVHFDADAIDFHPANRGYAAWRRYNDLSSEFGNLGLSNYGEWRILQIGKRPTTAAAQALDARGQLTDWERADAEPQPARAAEVLSRGHGASALDVYAEPMSPRAMGQADVRWAPDNISPDYRHLGVSGVSQEFAFTGAHLDALCTANAFDLSDAGDVVLFGLRGCMIVGADGTAAGTSLRLSEDMPDHTANHCVIGVWKRATGQLNAFTASTVPNWRLMEAYRQGGDRANLLATGRYVYRVGTHRPGSAHPIPGAFLQQGGAVVLRTLDDLEYTVTDVWDSGAVGDNIHAGRLDTNRTGPFFSSAGCQTVPGNFDNGTHRRRWADFRTAAGLSANNPTSENGRKFIYILLTGREARLTSQGRAASLTRLRSGSSSAAVRTLQTALTTAGQYHGAVTGSMDIATTMAFIAWQRANDSNKADGVVTPALARQLGVSLGASAGALVPVGQSLSVPGVVGAGRAELTSPLLAREHHLMGPNIILRWNAPPASRPRIDVLVHLHGFAPHATSTSPDALDFHRKETYSGLDFSGHNAAGAELYRDRALLGIIPHGYRTGRVTGGGSVDVYDFPGLINMVSGSSPAHDGLSDVIDFSLRRFEHDLLQQPAGSLSAERTILTAHSGGGARLVSLLARHDPHEIHLFDALYGAPTAAMTWAARHIARDAAALASRGQNLWAAYMASEGGALRAIFLPSDGTTPHNTALHETVECALLALSNAAIRDFLRKYYRVERGDPRVTGHSDIPKRYGWQLLVDAAAELEPRLARLTAPAHCPASTATGIGSGMAFGEVSPVIGGAEPTGGIW